MNEQNQMQSVIAPGHNLDQLTIAQVGEGWNEQDKQRFLSRLVVNGECLEYSGAHTSKGYGSFQIGRKSLAAHRVAWSLKNGPVPNGIMVLHRCDNRPCCNVEHLFLGTAQDNSDDKVAKGRQAKGSHLANGARFYAARTHCKWGHEYTPDNTRSAADGARDCKACAYRRKQKAKQRKALTVCPMN